jgi:hypothetical protein
VPSFRGCADSSIRHSIVSSFRRDDVSRRGLLRGKAV